MEAAMQHAQSTVFLALGLCATVVFAQEKQAGGVELTSNTFRPERRELRDQDLKRLTLPAGFKVELFARDLGKPRMLAVADDGTVYVSRRGTNDVVALADQNGKAGPPKTVVEGIESVHGIALRGNRIFLASPTSIWVAEREADGSPSKPRVIADGFPNAGQHQSRTIGIGPDGMLYINVGSSCNNCMEPNKENATMQRMTLNGESRSAYAKGLRNTLGFAWHPETGELWGMDHGTDFLGNDVPPEELNRLIAGKDYGWPRCYGKQKPDPTRDKPESMTREEYCLKTEASVLDYQAHSSPIGFAFYTGGQFPAEYRNDAFIAMRGSWNRNPPTGYKVVRLKYEGGKPVRFEDFMTGFLVDNGAGALGRPSGVAVAKDGALLVSDDTAGVIYRISYTGPSSAETPSR
jgi:glucose/arabinose dehydrogenase